MKEPSDIDILKIYKSTIERELYSTKDPVKRRQLKKDLKTVKNDIKHINKKEEF